MRAEPMAEIEKAPIVDGRIERPDWGPAERDDSRATGVVGNLGGRLTLSTAPAPASRMTDDGAGTDAADTLAESGLDVAGMRRRIKDGIRTAEEVQQAYDLTAAERQRSEERRVGKEWRTQTGAEQ